MCSTAAVSRCQVPYEPSIGIIAQGRKRIHLGTASFVYDASHFLVLSVPLPFECETHPAKHGPLLGISVGVSPATVAELAMEMETPHAAALSREEAIRAHPMDARLHSAAVRGWWRRSNHPRTRGFWGPRSSGKSATG